MIIFTSIPKIIHTKIVKNFKKFINLNLLINKIRLFGSTIRALFRNCIFLIVSILLDFSRFSQCLTLMLSTIVLIRLRLIGAWSAYPLFSFDFINALAFSAAIIWGIYSGMVRHNILACFINSEDFWLMCTNELSHSIHAFSSWFLLLFAICQISLMNQMNNSELIDLFNANNPYTTNQDRTIMKLILHFSQLH